MKHKNVLVIILTVVIFLSATVLGISTVYRVNEVTVRTSLVSEAAQAEAEALQKRLLEVYEKKSTLFLEETEAVDVMEEFPYFRMLSFEKSYPNRIIISVAEDAEVYAVPTLSEENAYYIVGADGTVLGIRNDYTNRLDGTENLLIEGLTATGEKGQVLFGDERISSLFAFCAKFSELLGGIRRNVAFIKIKSPTSSLEETIFLFTMREGVKIYVGNPLTMTEEKAQAVFDKYSSLSDEERLTGRIAVSDKEGELLLTYASKDEFGG